jgi:hypothetical protein
VRRGGPRAPARRREELRLGNSRGSRASLGPWPDQEHAAHSALSENRTDRASVHGRPPAPSTQRSKETCSSRSCGARRSGSSSSWR